MSELDDVSGPWYKEFWAWFVFTPLIIVIIACSVFVTIAFQGREDVVTDDYYKVGKMINQEFEPTHRAKALGLLANLVVDASNQFIEVRLTESEWGVQDSLVLNLSHPAEAERDRFITLTRVDDLVWRSNIKQPLSGRWYLRLSSINDAGIEQWRLQGEAQLSEPKPILLQ